MTRSRFAILDPSAGISGDMLLGALIDAGAPQEWLLGLPARLGFPDVSVDVERTLRCGISATKVNIRLADGRAEDANAEFVTPRDPHDHGEQAHHHANQHSAANHRHLPDLLRVVENARLSPWVRERAIRALVLLCSEEGRVHGVPAESVALHEVGAVDAVLDIVGGIEGFERLGVDTIFSRPLALGTGWIRTAHGVMPIPAPVTARLAEGLEIGPNGPVVGEATTPTGAVLLRVLSAGAPPSHWRAVCSGWGAGGRDPEHYPNALRLFLADSVPEAGQVVTVSTDVDDLSPEYIEPMREALVEAGALDVQVWTTHMKKGRPGFRVEVICGTDRADRVTEALFLHSTTAGVRRAPAERITLPRREIQVPAGNGSLVAVKILETPGGPRFKAEFEDIRRVAGQLGRPAHELAHEIENAARAQVTAAATGTSRSAREQA